MVREATLPLLFVLSPALQPDATAVIERQIRRSLLRRGPILLGTEAEPYAPVPSGSPLRSLLAADGLEVAVTTSSPRILRELDLLAELDRRHAVSVRMLVPTWSAEDPQRRLDAVRGLTAEGIATSVVLQAQPGGTWDEETLRFLLEGSLEAGAWDVEIATGALKRSLRARLLAGFRRLRLEHGFPRVVAGRA
jgi:DNA repair photolyase